MPNPKATQCCESGILLLAGVPDSHFKRADPRKTGQESRNPYSIGVLAYGVGTISPLNTASNKAEEPRRVHALRATQT